MYEYEIFRRLLDERHLTPYKVHKATGISTATLSDWKNGKSTPKIDKMQKIAEFLGVTVDYLMTGEDRSPAPELNRRDLRDIEKSLGELMSDIENGSALYYGGVPSELSDDNKSTLESALRIALTTIKKENKKKYNPNKNKQNNK